MVFWTQCAGYSKMTGLGKDLASSMLSIGVEMLDKSSEPVAATISTVGRLQDFSKLNKPHLDGKLLFAEAATTILQGSNLLNSAIETT